MTDQQHRGLGVLLALASLAAACGSRDDSDITQKVTFGPGGSGGIQSPGQQSGGQNANTGASSNTGSSGNSASGGTGGLNASPIGAGGTGGSPEPPPAGGAGAEPTPPQGACGNLTFTENTKAANFDTDRFAWNDATCSPREASLTRAGAGFVRQYKYQVDGKTRTVTGTGANGHDGWGYTVNHGLSNGGLVPGKAGSFKPLFVGPHHAIYEYRFDVVDNLTVTQHWFFATGRDHPVLAITYDMTKAPKGLNADTRTPYGDMAWDGDENAANTVVSGVAWGDRYKFTTTEAPLTMDSTWDYTQPNLVPYVMMWAEKNDAEMGAVQTQTWQQKDAGGYWFYENWGKTSANQVKSDGQIGNMPVTWNWTYQINQYELCIEDPACLKATTRSHRLAWGSNYGAIGGVDQSGMYSAYGDDKKLSGWPFQSYSVFMVLGKHTDEAVMKQVRQIELVQKTTLSASLGQVSGNLPGGVGRTDTVETGPVGYDGRYSVWHAVAANNQLTLNVAVSESKLEGPVLVVSSFQGTNPPEVKVNGVVQVPNRDVFVSLVPERQELWVTFRGGWSAAQEISIQ